MILPFTYTSGRTGEFSLDRLPDGSARIAFTDPTGHTAWRALTRTECVAAAKILLDATDQLTCSFCGKSQHEVTRLIAGPAGISICDDCTALCSAIVIEEAGRP